MSLIETLETRRMMSTTPIAYLDKGFLNVVGTPGDDMLVVRMDSANPNRVLVLSKTDRTEGYGYDVKTLFSVHKSWVQRVRMVLGAGNDSATIYDSVTINASIFCGPGNDSAHGGGGNDILWGGDGADLLTGKGGDDQLYGELGGDTLYGGDGNDLLVGGGGVDKLYGMNGNDLLDAADGARNDFLSGGAGWDQCRADKTSTLLELQKPLAAEIEEILKT